METNRLPDAGHQDIEGRSAEKGGRERIWRVFYTSPRAERRAEDMMKRAGLEVFLPVVQSKRQWSDRIKTVEEPLFRSYIFARVDERERIVALELPHVVRCIAYNGRPSIVSEDEIERIEKLQHYEGKMFSIDIRTPIGQAVVVRVGPLAGLRGDVIAHRGQKRVIVRVDSVKQALSLTLPDEWLEIVDE
jgi:transcriptional antiterminator RfaH